MVDTCHVPRMTARQASAARIEAAWTMFVKGVWLQFKRKVPRGVASEWIADTHKNSWRTICGHSQRELIAQSGVEAATVRYQRKVLATLLALGEGLKNSKGEPRPALPKETFKRYAKWAAAEKKASATLARRRAEQKREEEEKETLRQTYPDFGLMALKLQMAARPTSSERPTIEAKDVRCSDEK